MQALQDLANVQARVTERNQKLDHLETVDLSLKDAYRSKEAEVVQLRKELQANHEEHRNALQEKDNAVAELEKRIEDTKQKMEREKLDEIVRGLYDRIMKKKVEFISMGNSSASYANCPFQLM